MVNNTVAAPLPYCYTLLELAHQYHDGGLQQIQTGRIYREPFSDLAPMEQLYEMWQGRDDKAAPGIAAANRDKLAALSSIVQRLEGDLERRGEHSAAPALPRRELERESENDGLPMSSRLWLEFARLNTALVDMEAHTTRAMPSHEREARFKSAVLTKRLEGVERGNALARMKEATGIAIDESVVSDAVVYRLKESSADFNVRPNDLGYALSPAGDTGFLHRNTRQLNAEHQLRLPPRLREGTVADNNLTEFKILNIDRANLTIALEPHRNNRVKDGFTRGGYPFKGMEDAGVADFSADVTLDPVPTDFNTEKIKLTLIGIGNPAVAADYQDIARAMGAVNDETAPKDTETPAAQFLWTPDYLAGVDKELADKDDRDALCQAGVALNESQWDAWQHSLSHRLSLIWGPPGTGKSSTLAAIAVGAVHRAHRASQGLKILLITHTYNAVDNLLRMIATSLKKTLIPGEKYDLLRLYSGFNPPNPDIEREHKNIRQIAVDHYHEPELMWEIIDALEKEAGIVVAATVPGQIHNLAVPFDDRSPENTI